MPATMPDAWRRARRPTCDGSRSPTARSSISASRSVTARSPGATRPPGRRLTRASTCIGWWASARSANRSRSSAASTSRARRGRPAYEPHPRAGRGAARQQDRDRGHRSPATAASRSTARTWARPTSASRSAAPVASSKGACTSSPTTGTSPSVPPASCSAPTRPVADSAELLARRAQLQGGVVDRRARPGPGDQPDHEQQVGERAGRSGGRGCRRTASWRHRTTWVRVLTASRVAAAGTPARRAASRLAA